jgi:signal transduction histidine kinase
MSAIETGNLKLKLETIDYCPFINKIISMNQELAKNKNITILSSFEIKDNFTICVDKIKVSQVINNFIQNAIKFSYSFGKIILKVEIEGEYITTKVIDEGEGIPKSQRDKLFKVFSKTSIAPTGGERSDGLGLYISRNIIEAHDGIIAFEENLIKGSTFYFKLRKDLDY